jgi:hypothetical protein
MAYIPKAKIVDYLLSDSHPVGRFKARFFRSIGYSISTPETLEDALLSIAFSNSEKREVASPHAVKFIVDGTIRSPDDNIIRLRTVWIMDNERNAPRFVTAYPI